MNDNIPRAEQIQRESDNTVVECLTNEIDQQAERSKHILTALHAAAVPLDLLTAEVLHDLGVNMGALIRSACED